MYTTLYYVHKYAVLIFLLIYLVKAFLLVTNKKDTLQKFNATVKIPEMIVSFAFLVSGIWMLFLISEVRTLFIIKLVLVAFAIPMAIVGFRREIKLLAAGSFILIVGAYGLAEINKKQYITQNELPSSVVVDASSAEYDIIEHGKALYQTQCIVCHGEEGNLQMSGANILGQSTLTIPEMEVQIKKGKLTMPGYEGHFTDFEIKALAEYVTTFRNQ